MYMELQSADKLYQIQFWIIIRLVLTPLFRSNEIFA